MPNALATNNAARAQDSDRNDVLNAIGAKWSKFSKQELSPSRPTTNWSTSSSPSTTSRRSPLSATSMR